MATLTPGLLPIRRRPPLVRSRASRPWRWAVIGFLSFTAVYCLAWLLEQVRVSSLLNHACVALGLALLHQYGRDLAETSVAAACVAVVLFSARRCWPRLCLVERAIGKFAGHKTRAIVYVGLLPMLLRLALMPVLHVPQPLIADEFGYLLLADTFASGRITNPTHPMWRHFETIYAFHQPTYTSIYPIAPAILMAIPKVLGASPWIGVWFATGLMCAVICWMLQGWVPSKWAFLGGLIVACRFGITSPWMNTYWGGAVTATGGALALGALARILRRPRSRDAFLFGIGIAILAHSRPYEGFLLSVPLGLVFLHWLIRNRRWSAKSRLTRVALPVGAVCVALVGLTAYYNWRVTGHPSLMPYGLHQKLYGTPQSFYWQAPILDAAGVHRHQDIADVFRWQLDAYKAGFSWRTEGIRLMSFWHFYLQPLLTLPLLFVPFLFRNRGVRIALAGVVIVLAGNAVYPFFFPHYAALLSGFLILLVVEGLRRLRALRFRCRPVGLAISRAVLVLVLVSSAFTVLGGLLLPWVISATYTHRSQVLEKLRQRGGKHVVLVHYRPAHSFHYGVVFNDADIDRSPVIWARELDPSSNMALARYFPDRDVWLFDPDEEEVKLRPFAGKPYIDELVDGAGLRDDPKLGVSPGGIVSVFGGNFIHGALAETTGSLLGALPLELTAINPRDGNVFAAAVNPKDLPRTVPKNLDVVSVWFDQTPAAIYGLAHSDLGDAVTVKVPSNVRGSSTEITVRAGALSVVKKVPVLPATPGILQMRTANSDLVAILQRLDGSLITPAHPAHRGEVVRLFAIGLGARLAAAPGGASDLSGLQTPSYPIVVGVNHHGVRLISATGHGSMTGVVEVTFQVPEDAPTGGAIPLAIAAVVDGQHVFGNRSSLPID